MLKTRAVIPLVIGLAIGVFAIRYFVNVVQKAKGASSDMVQVVCAGADIMPTVEIKGPMLEVKSMPKVAAPKLFIGDLKEVDGRVASQSIPVGQPIVQSMLAPKGTLPGLAVRIPPGMRAVAVQVDESAGVAGWLKPGSRVDVIAVMTGRDGSTNETISKVILTNAEVLAVGQDSGTRPDAAASIAKTVTLAVAPPEMAKLHLATSRGKIRLAMRNQTDEGNEQRMASTTDNELLGIAQNDDKKSLGGFLGGFLSKLPKPEAPPTDKEASTPKPEPASAEVRAPMVPVQRVYTVEVLNGSARYEVSFQGEGRNQTRVAAGRANAGWQQQAQEPQPEPAPQPAPSSAG